MSDLETDFENLASDVRALIGLLEEAGETYWATAMSRGLGRVEARHLAGATYILGCYGGVDTFSDLVIGARFSESEPLRYRNLNARLTHLRNRTFDSANAIAARRNW